MFYAIADMLPEAKLLAIICGVLLVLFVVYSFSTKEEKLSETTCICVFDIDNTITCGYEQAGNAIKECKRNMCKLAINTARTSPYHDDIKFDKINLEKSDIINDVYHGIDHNTNKKATHSNEQLFKKVAEEKIKHLYTLKNKYNIINPKRIILFDDLIENINLAKTNGFSAIHANGSGCGLNQHVVSEIKESLKIPAA